MMNNNYQSYQNHTLKKTRAAHISVRRVDRKQQHTLLWFLASGIGLVVSLGIGRILLG